IQVLPPSRFAPARDRGPHRRDWDDEAPGDQTGNATGFAANGAAENAGHRAEYDETGEPAEHDHSDVLGEAGFFPGPPGDIRRTLTATSAPASPPSRTS